MADKTVQTLLDYFTNPVYQKHGPTDQEPAGSGPGGAAATGKLVAGFRSPVNRDIMATMKVNRYADQMNDVAGIAGAAVNAANAKYGRNKKQQHRYNSLAAPDDQDQGI